jgi:hypothetical protein
MKQKNTDSYYDALPEAEARGVAVSKVMFEREVSATDPSRRPQALNDAEARLAELEKEMEREQAKYAAALSIQEEKESLLTARENIKNEIAQARGHLEAVAERKSALGESLAMVIPDQVPGRVMEMCGAIAACETAARVLPEFIAAKQKGLARKNAEIAAFLKANKIKE